MNEDYKITPVREHYEVYLNGEFFCSADTYREAENEIVKRRNDYVETNHLPCWF